MVHGSWQRKGPVLSHIATQLHSYIATSPQSHTATQLHRHIAFGHRPFVEPFVAMQLCGYVELWLYSYVAMWLHGYVACGHVTMWLCGYSVIRNFVRIPRLVDAHQCPGPMCDELRKIVFGEGKDKLPGNYLGHSQNFEAHWFPILSNSVIMIVPQQANTRAPQPVQVQLKFSFRSPLIKYPHSGDVVS